MVKRKGLEKEDDVWKFIREFQARWWERETREFLEFGERIRKAYERRKRELEESDSEVGNEEKGGN